MALKYTNADHTVIFDDSRNMSIPCVTGNTQFDEIEAAGTAIADYVAPAATWDSVRAERNQLLKDTDWQAGTDVTMTDAQKAYRQKLRDLPATNSDPTKIVFPDAP
jgi:hypothetical protein